MGDERIVDRLATSLGLRREDVCCVTREKNGGRFHGVALIFPPECSATSHQLAMVVNDALNIEAGLGNGALLDLFGARHIRFSRESTWFERLHAVCRPRFIDKKYAYLNKALAFALEPAETQEWSVKKDGCAVLIITSCCKDGSSLLASKHNLDRAPAIAGVLELHEEALRSIVRHAAPSHHLLAAPKTEAPVVTVPVKEVMPRRVSNSRGRPFKFTPVFATPEATSVEINV